MSQDPRTYVSPRETSPFARFELKRSHLTTRIPGGALNPGMYIATRLDITAKTGRAAALTVCAAAHDASDARFLLNALGLLA